MHGQTSILDASLLLELLIGKLLCELSRREFAPEVLVSRISWNRGHYGLWIHGDLCKTLLLLAGGSLPGMCRKLVTRRIG
jgi:hypothetical protein